MKHDYLSDRTLLNQFQKISPIHQFILEMKLILETLDLQGHSHIWQCAGKVTFSFPDYVQACKKSAQFIHSFLRYSRL